MRNPPLSLGLAPDVHQRLANAAQHLGTSASALCQQWIIEGLEQFEAEHSVHPGGSGRCSVRTGMSAIGPTPLPLQQ